MGNWLSGTSVPSCVSCFHKGSKKHGFAIAILFPHETRQDARYILCTPSQHHGYTEEEQDNILKAVNLLERSHGVMELPRMCEEFCQWLEAKRLLALANADRVMDVYRRRSAVIGFRCGVIFHILEQTEEETDACIRFAKTVADYVLAMQMEMFGLRLDKQQQDNEAIPVYKSRNTLLFAQLPEQFTLFDASRERGDEASRETIRKMISR